MTTTADLNHHTYADYLSADTDNQQHLFILLSKSYFGQPQHEAELGPEICIQPSGPTFTSRIASWLVPLDREWDWKGTDKRLASLSWFVGTLVRQLRDTSPISQDKFDQNLWKRRKGHGGYR